MKSLCRIFRRILARNLLEKGIKAEIGYFKTNGNDTAKRFYRRAAILGNRQAQVFLAYYYASEYYGLNINRRLSLAWFKRAAKSGDELCSLVSPVRGLDAKNQIQQFMGLLMATSEEMI